MRKKDVLKKWNGFFSRQLARGYTWNQIRHALASKGYKAFSIEWLIQRYRKQQVIKHRAVTIFLALAFAVMIATPFILNMTGITGFIIGGPGAVYYVDATNGNDANNGLSPETAIRTIAKVNSLSLSAGDSVLFHCGSTWRVYGDKRLITKSGKSTGNITYSSYGDCINRKPLFLGGINVSHISNWTNQGNNIWMSNFVVNQDVGNLISDDEGFGWKKSTSAELSSQGNFFYDSASDRTYVYSSSNPASYYSNIELALNTEAHRGIIHIESKYVVVENLDVRNAADFGINVFWSNNVVIRNNTVKNIGGGYQFDTLRYGTGIDLHCPNHHIEIHDNLISGVYDVGIGWEAYLTCGGGGAWNVSFIYISNNVVTHCGSAYGSMSSNISNYVDNIHIFSNTFAFSGQGWHKGQRPDKNMAILLNNAPYNSTSYYLYDNIIFNTTHEYVNLGWDSTTRWKGEDPLLNNNLYFESARNKISWKNTIYKDWALWQINENQESNGLEANPIFVSVNPYDNQFLVPSPGSPACTMSSTGSYVGALPCAEEVVPPLEPFCGDSTCDADENCSTCELDCGTCPEEQQPLPVSYCGDNVCDANENCSTCTSDCGSCPLPEPEPEPYCGDGNCSLDENCDSCEADCGVCHVVPSCGDGSCNGLENCSTCEADCGSCPVPEPFCGDSECNGNENCSTCESDCGSCPVVTTTTTKSSGGGGGGGSASTIELESDWLCGEWSECIDGKQTQTCEHRIKNTAKTNTRKCDSTSEETESSSKPLKEEKEAIIVPKKETIEEEQSTEAALQKPDSQLPGRVVNPGVRTDYPFIIGLLSMIIVLVFMISTHHRPAASKGTQITIQSQEAEPDYNQELEDYCKKATNAGYTAEEIKSELLKVGWKLEIIERFINNPSEKNMVEKEAAVADNQVDSANLGLNEPSETAIEILFKQRMSNLDNQVNTSIPLSKT